MIFFVQFYWEHKQQNITDFLFDAKPNLEIISNKNFNKIAAKQAKRTQNSTTSQILISFPQKCAQINPSYEPYKYFALFGVEIVIDFPTRHK